MRRFRLGLAVTSRMLCFIGFAEEGPYKVLKTVKVGGVGGYDYVQADVEGRRLYFARSGAMPRANVYNVDTPDPVAEIPTTNAHGAVVDPKSNHGFITSNPVLMFDAK